LEAACEDSPVTDGPEAAPLLLVEDDPQLGPLLVEVLSDAGYAVDLARDGQAGLHRGLTRAYEVLVVDRGLPAIEGVDLIRRLRSRGVTTPVMVLTALAAVADRIEGLDAGAEDYLVKPFDIDELLARLRALRRRHTTTAATIGLGERLLDVPARRVYGDGRPDVELSGRECDLLHLLAARPDRVFTREELMAAVFADAEGSGVVDTYVHYLRRKLGRDAVRTVHGLGYRMGTA
jgi:two-component system, OmpR family, response regulator QseB